MRKVIILLSVVILVAVSASLSSIAGSFSDGGGLYGSDDGSGAGADISDIEEILPGETSYLEAVADIMCEDYNRDPGGGWRTLYMEMAAFYDGPIYSEFPGTSYPWAFNETFELCDGNETLGGEFNCTFVGWPDLWLSGIYPSPPWNALPEPYEPYVSLRSDIIGWPYNPKLFRLEGNCQVFTQMYHEQYPVNKDGAGPARSDENPVDGFCVYTQHDMVEGDGEGFYPGTCGGDKTLLNPLTEVPPGCEFCNFNVHWDNDKHACEVIGGDWLDSWSYGGYQCCGDDWIWVYNRPINYNSGRSLQEISRLEEEDNLCLYSDTAGEPGYGRRMSVEGIGSYSSSSYRCTIGESFHSSYDPVLDWDLEEDNDARIVPDPGLPFNFVGTGGFETDVGKWSDSSHRNPMFCYHEFNDAMGGEHFEWLSIPDAADRNQIVCEAYLGYNWTGSKCCGYDGSTYNDPEEACDGKAILTSIAGSSDIAAQFGSPYFESVFMSACEDNLLNNPINPACFEGRTLREYEITGTNSAIKDVYNLGGILHFCSHADGSVSYPGFEYDEKCTILGTEDLAKSLTICGYKDDSWQGTYSASAYMGYDASLATSAEQVRSSVKVSEFPVDELVGGNIQRQECCFFGSCWNGTKCVSRDNQAEGVYQYHSGIWEPYDWGDEPDGTIYLCNDGEWISTDAMYNWYYDTRKPNFCTHKHSCVCPDKSSDPGYSDNCNADDLYESEPCTKDPNFYKEDHFCEAVYDGTAIVDSRWTSRTKMIALQLLAIAGESDYTLYCDTPENVLNFPDEIQQSRFPVNNICVIEFGGNRAIGLSFNPPDSENALDEFLFAPDTGFVNRILGMGTTASCPADVSSDTEKYGKFGKCIDGKLYINEKTNSIIYSKRGLGLTDDYLPEADMVSIEDMFDDEVDLLDGFLSGYSGNLAEDIRKLSTASDFRRLYIKRDSHRSIFGFIEERYDRNAGTVPLSNYMSVHYHGFGDVCKNIDFVNDVHFADLACGGNGEDFFVVQKKPVDVRMTYWQDLTSKLRVR